MVMVMVDGASDDSTHTHTPTPAHPHTQQNITHKTGNDEQKYYKCMQMWKEKWGERVKGGCVFFGCVVLLCNITSDDNV